MNTDRSFRLKSVKICKIRVICVICGLLAGGFFLFHEVQGQPPGRQLSAMTFNVGTLSGQRPDMERVREIIAGKGCPDLLFLQEVPGGKEARVLAFALDHASLVYAPYGALRGGLAVISRYPLKLIRLIPIGGYAALAAEAEVEGEKILLLSAHLERIRGFRIAPTGVELSWRLALNLLKDELWKETPRTRAVHELQSWISAQKYGRVIVAGDFNTVPFSRAIRKMDREFKDALWPGFQYLAGSYRELPLPLEPRIDYIFHSPGLKCLSAGVIKESAGDHYPVRAVFNFGRG